MCHFELYILQGSNHVEDTVGHDSACQEQLL